MALSFFIKGCAGYDVVDDIDQFTIADVREEHDISRGSGSSQDPFIMDIGEAAELIILDTRDPNGSRVLNGFLDWRVSASQVLSVSNGTVTSISSGSAEVFAVKVLPSGQEQEIGHWFFDTFQFERIEIENNASSVNLFPTETRQLTAAYYNTENVLDPSVNIQWTVSEESVASISEEGLLTALDIGEVTVTAMTGQGVSDDIAVIIEEDTTRIFSIELAFETDVIELGDSMLLEAAALTFTGREAAGQDLSWSSSDPEILSVSETGKLQALAVGQATITVTLEDDPEITASKSFTVQNLFPMRTGTLVSGRGGTDGTVTLYVSRVDTLLRVRLNEDFFGARIPGPTLYMTNDQFSTAGGLRIQEIEHGPGENREFLLPGNPDIQDFNYLIYHCEPANVIYGSFLLD